MSLGFINAGSFDPTIREYFDNLESDHKHFKKVVKKIESKLKIGM